jgi:threonine-phosphate decarboxylase
MEKRMKHGGDTLSYKHMYNGELIDFSSNINPLGFPKGLIQTIVDDINELTKYPDIQYRELKQEIARYLGCGTNEVLLGNGAVEIIDNMIMLFSRIVVFVPCFCEYIERAEIYQKEVIKLALNKEFSIDIRLLRENIKAGDLIILGNPNNPTGKRISLEKLKELIELVEARNSFLLLDEAFFEFCLKDYDSIKLFGNSKNVCVIRAATKFFALPGIRLGYGFANTDIAEKYNSNVLPWNINSIANSVGLKIFKEADYIRESKEYIKLQREYLTAELKKIKQVKVFETDTNFILLKLKNTNEDEIFEYLLQKGIVIRKASSFEGLDESFIRIAIKGHEDNKKIIQYIEEFCSIKTNIEE